MLDVQHLQRRLSLSVGRLIVGIHRDGRIRVKRLLVQLVIISGYYLVTLWLPKKAYNEILDIHHLDFKF